MNCATCKHFVKITDPQNVLRIVGNCICHPPQFVLMPNQQGFSPAWMFPAVEGDGICGQHLEKPPQIMLQ